MRYEWLLKFLSSLSSKATAGFANDGAAATASASSSRL